MQTADKAGLGGGTLANAFTRKHTFLLFIRKQLLLNNQSQNVDDIGQATARAAKLNVGVTCSVTSRNKIKLHSVSFYKL